MPKQTKSGYKGAAPHKAKGGTSKAKKKKAMKPKAKTPPATNQRRATSR